MNSKYSNFLTVLLVIIIIAIVAIIGFLGYRYYQDYVIKSSSESFFNEWQEEVGNNKNPSTEDKEDASEDEEIEYDGVDEGTNQGNGSSSQQSVKRYNGFIVSGTIEIPATNLKCPILAQSEYSLKSLETSVIELYGPGLNQVGITTIAGHNYRRSGVFFSDNKKLKVGDKIFITDSTGKRLSYTIYDKFETESNKTDYMTKDTQGAIEISLSTCKDYSDTIRLIILARADV